MLTNEERCIARDRALRYPPRHGFHWFSSSGYSIDFIKSGKVENNERLEEGDPAVAVAVYRHAGEDLTRQLVFKASCDIANDLHMKMVDYLSLLDVDPVAVAEKLDKKIKGGLRKFKNKPAAVVENNYLS